MSGKARKIVVDGREFYYRVDETWQETGGYEVTFRAQLHRHPQHALHISFAVLGEFYVGSGLLHGIPSDGDDEEHGRVNLHTPGVAAQLVFYALNEGWQPEQKPFRVENGVNVLKFLGYKLGQSGSNISGRA